MTYDHLPPVERGLAEALEQARDDTCEQVKYLRYRGYDGAASEAVKRLTRIDTALAAARAYRPAPDVREALERLHRAVAVFLDATDNPDKSVKLHVSLGALRNVHRQTRTALSAPDGGDVRQSALSEAVMLLRVLAENEAPGIARDTYLEGAEDVEALKHLNRSKPAFPTPPRTEDKP